MRQPEMGSVRSNEGKASSTNGGNAIQCADVQIVEGNYPQVPRQDSCVDPALSREQLCALWQEHRRWVAAIVLAYKPWWIDADDILQNVALAVVRKGHTVREPQAFKGWLRTVAINSARLAARNSDAPIAHTKTLQNPRGATAVGTRSVSDHVAETDPAQMLTLADEGRALVRLAAELPEGYREPLLLKAVEGLSYRHIGQIMGLPETTVETRIARARKMLRERAANEGLGPVTQKEIEPKAHVPKAASFFDSAARSTSQGCSTERSVSEGRAARIEYTAWTQDRYELGK